MVKTTPGMMQEHPAHSDEAERLQPGSQAGN